jgi:hypothetical protein
MYTQGAKIRQKGACGINIRIGTGGGGGFMVSGPI